MTHVGLAALLPYATKYGQIPNANESLKLTTGHAATVATIRLMIKNIERLANIDKRTLRFGIIGAAGSIGHNVANRFVHTGLTNLCLIDVKKRINAVSSLAKKIKNANSTYNISFHSYEEIETIPNFDIESLLQTQPILG